jgi:succinyl-CoA synthetase beta subunit
VLSPDVAHKTEAGGVVLNIASAEQLADAARRIFESIRAAHPHARIEGVLIQSMERGLAEVLVGYRRDPQAGPLVTLAAGGILAEIYDDSAVRIAPVDEATALKMIDEVKGLAPIRGYRNLPLGDLGALARTIAAVSRLALIPEIWEGEINPVIVKAQGVVAVDALLSFSRPAASRPQSGAPG